MTEEQYFADHAEFESERRRLEMLGKLFDDTSRRHLRNAGICEGWRCLDVGAGGGSITRWLSAEVGPNGRVIALDLNCRFLRDLDLPNVEVRELDVLKGDIGVEQFDLVYSRFLLMHVQNREVALRKIASAVKPGGCLVVQDGDYSTLRSVDHHHSDSCVFDDVWRRECEHAIESDWIDVYFGWKLPIAAQDLALTDLGHEGTTWVRQGGSLAGKYYVRTISNTRDVFVGNGIVTDEEWDVQQRALLDPTFRFVDLTMYTIWGQKPT